MDGNAPIDWVDAKARQIEDAVNKALAIAQHDEKNLDSIVEGLVPEGWQWVWAGSPSAPHVVRMTAFIPRDHRRGAETGNPTWPSNIINSE